MLEFTFWFSITLYLIKYKLLARKQLFLKDDKTFTITHIYNSLRDRNLLEGTIHVPSCDPDRELASYIMSDSTQSGRHSKLAVFKLQYVCLHDVDFYFHYSRWDVFVKVHVCTCTTSIPLCCIIHYRQGIFRILENHVIYSQ